MTISFSSATGNLFNRLGKLGACIANMRTHQAVQFQAMTNITTGVVAQYNSESDIQAIMGSSYIGVLGGVEGIGSLCQQIATMTLNRAVYRDNPRFAQTLQEVNLIASIQEVITQMKAQGATVLELTVTATPTTFVGTGDGVVVASVTRAFDGLTQQNALAETLLVTCTNDSYIGGATAGQEGFTVTGVGAQTDVFAFNWPLGSNASLSINAVNGSVDNTGGNLLTNSGFDSFTGNTPNNWDIEEGAAGTQIFSETGLIYGGDSALRILGDGSTLTAIEQEFNSSTGTLGQLSPLTQYAFNIYSRRDGVAPANGTMTIDLADAAGVTLLDSNGVANSFDIDLTGLTTEYLPYNGVFRTPEILPDPVYLRMRLTGTPLTVNRSVYFDLGACASMSMLYPPNGPSVAIFSGASNFVQAPVPDTATVAITNSRGAAGTLNTWQTALAVLLPSSVENGFIWPYSSTPSISDSLLS